MTTTAKFESVGASSVVLTDGLHSWRWLDAWGPNVVKYFNNFDVPVSGADTPLAATVTLVEAGGGDTTLTVPATQPGALLITADAAENDGANVQWLTNQWFMFDGRYPTYFGIKFQINDATQTDLLAGVCITDTTLLGGMTDGVYVRKEDASTTMYLVVEEDSVESVTAIGTVRDATWHVAEWYFDGTTWHGYFDGAPGGTITGGYPHEDNLAPSIHFLTGETVANTCYIDWIKIIQVREAV